MRPVPFPESNLVLAAPPGEPDCEDLPVWRGDGLVVSLWRPTWRERLSVLFFGRVWFMARGFTHPPVSLAARRSNFDAKVSG